MTEELEELIESKDNGITYFVDSTAKLIGEVEIGDGCGIWPGSLIEGDRSKIEIEEDVYIMPNSTIRSTDDEPVQLGKGSLISPGARLEGCKLGDNTFIGIDAVIMPGVELGENVVVNNNAIIEPEKKIPANSIVAGEPAEVIDEVDGSVLERISKLRKHLDWKSEEYQIMLKRGEKYDVYDIPKRPDEILEKYEGKESDESIDIDQIRETLKNEDFLE